VKFREAGPSPLEFAHQNEKWLKQSIQPEYFRWDEDFLSENRLAMARKEA
jgi:hypothetical protein